MARLAVIGTGYVGTVVAACFAELANDVVALEVDQFKLSALRQGVVPFYEPGLDDLLAAGARANRLRFTDNYQDAMANSDILFICVGTPPREDGSPDLTFVEAAYAELAANLDHYHLLVNKSTMPPGTAKRLSSDLARSVNKDLFDVVANPEFLREGNAIHDFLHPERIVVGCDAPDALDAIAEVYGPILEQRLAGGRSRERRPPLIRTSPTTAELAKYASNAFLATKVSFINEIAALCELIGADITEVAAAMGLDPRIGKPFLEAGLGWGGSCLGKDTLALIHTAKAVGSKTRILQAALDVNKDQRRCVVDRIAENFPSLGEVKVAVLGLAFKAGTDDVRDSPAIEVCQHLLGEGATVVAYDPLVRSTEVPRLRLAGSPYEAARDADAVLVATDWPELLDIDLKRLRAAMRGSLFFDGRNKFSPQAVLGHGFCYTGVGHHPQAPADLESSRR